jgi:hypothetical protein
MNNYQRITMLPISTRFAFFALGVFSLSACRSQAAGPGTDQGEQPGRSVLKLRVPGRTSEVFDVVATGVGSDSQQAQQNAFSSAIEQALGVLVDAETIVENDQLVRDQVLKFSRGYVNDFEVLERADKGGLHFVRIRAKVAAGRLGEKLKAQDIVARKIPGSLLYNTLIQKVRFAESTREMFRTATVDFRPDKLLTVTMVDTPPVIENDGLNVKLTVAYRLTSNLEAWKSIHTKLNPLLRSVATKQLTSKYIDRSNLGSEYGFQSQPPIYHDDDFTLIWIFEKSTSVAGTTNWDGYLIPEPLRHELYHLARRHQAYQVRLTLKDAENRAIASEKRHPSYCHVSNWMGSYRVASIGPLLFWTDYDFRTSRDFTLTFNIDAEELARVDKCEGSIELTTDE